MRKWFMARGWDVGKSVRSHVCPSCMHKEKPPQPQPQPPPQPPPLLKPAAVAHPVNPIIQAWEGASYDDRKMFLYLMQETMKSTWLHVVGEAAPTKVEAPAPKPPPKVVEQPSEPEPAAEEDEPADWWTAMVTTLAGRR
jgi:hypothetical protein